MADPTQAFNIFDLVPSLPLTQGHSLYTFKNGRTDVIDLHIHCTWRARRNINPSLHAHPHLPNEGFGAVLTPVPHPLGHWRPKSLRTHF